MAEIDKARLIELAEAKLEDAKLLLSAGRAANAYYLAGYAVELGTWSFIMVAQQTVSGVFDTASRLVDFLEQDGFDIEVAVWVLDEEGRGRLYKSEGELKQTIRVAETVARHREQLPEWHDVLYSVVKSDDRVVRAVTSVRSPDGRVRGAYSNGIYVDEAYVFRPAA
jgi:hypothetical protein